MKAKTDFEELEKFPKPSGVPDIAMGFILGPL
jgi:hypothetical protein